MKPKTPKPAFTDRRGTITDILDGVPLDSVTRISSKKGVARGNHVHKKTIQYTYVLSGRIRYLCRRGKGKTRAFVMGPGSLTASPAGEAHAVVALTDCEFLVFSKGPRRGKNYEADTYRLETPLGG